MHETGNKPDAELDHWLAVNLLGCQPTEEPDDWRPHDRPMVWTRPEKNQQSATTLVGVPWKPQSSSMWTHTWYRYSPSINHEQSVKLLERLMLVYPDDLPVVMQANGAFSFYGLVTSSLPMVLTRGLKRLLDEYPHYIHLLTNHPVEVEQMIGEKAYERYR